MDRYETEEQQIEAIKQFWKDNGMAIAFGIVLGLGGLISWRWYSNSLIESKEAASSAYQESIEKFVESEDIESLQAFVRDNGDTGYSHLASLIVAQQALEKDDIATAKSALESVTSLKGAVADVAKVRLAKLHIQSADYDDALTVLNSVESNSFDDQVHELKGDALFAKGDFSGAESAYSQALVELPGDINIQMKLDNIAFARTQANAADTQEVSQDSE